MSAEAAPGRRDGSLVGAATEAISSQILHGELTAGDRLPTERELVEQLGVSRTVLREALSSLEALGLLETRGTRGRFVAAGGSSERSRTLVGAWLHQHAREILEVDEIRSVLEAHAIRSMSRWDAIDAAQEAGAAARLQAEALERGDPLAAADGDATFHRTLCSYTKNHALRTLVDGLIDASRKGAYAVYSLPDTAAGSVEQHRRIVAALALSDVEAAARARPGAHARRGAPLLGRRARRGRRRVIRRFSLVRKRPELSRDEFLDRWTGEHVELAKRLAGLRGYVIHILDGPSPPYDGIAVTTFATREDAERAFADPELAEGLARTRDDFAASVEVFFAEEHVIVEEER